MHNFLKIQEIRSGVIFFKRIFCGKGGKNDSYWNKTAFQK